MSGTPSLGTNTTDNNGQQWAALDSRNERLVEASHPLLRAPEEGRTDADHQSASGR